MGCLCRGWFQLPPLPSLTEAVIACNEALRLIPARWESCWPCRTGCSGLEKLGAFPLPRSVATGLLTPKPSCLTLLSPEGLWGWKDALPWGAQPVDGQDTAAGGSDAFVLLSVRQNGGCPQGFCGLGWHWQPRWAGGCCGRVMAWPGCPCTECCCLGQLPLQDQCLPHCRDLSLCPETSVHPSPAKN